MPYKATLGLHNVLFVGKGAKAVRQSLLPYNAAISLAQRLDVLVVRCDRRKGAAVCEDEKNELMRTISTCGGVRLERWVPADVEVMGKVSGATVQAIETVRLGSDETQKKESYSCSIARRTRGRKSVRATIEEDAAGPGVQETDVCQKIQIPRPWSNSASSLLALPHHGLKECRPMDCKQRN